MSHALHITVHALRITCLSLLMTLSFVQPSVATIDHGLWDALLHRHVDQNGRVAYRDSIEVSPQLCWGTLSV